MNDKILKEIEPAIKTTEGDEHPKPRYDDVDIPVIVLLGIFSAIMTFVIICFVQGLYYQWDDIRRQADWRDRNLTPQEQKIVDQRDVRDSFFEADDGKIFVSADVGAEMLIAKKGDLSQFTFPEEPGQQPKVEGKSEPSTADDQSKVKDTADQANDNAGSNQ